MVYLRSGRITGEDFYAFRILDSLPIPAGDEGCRRFFSLRVLGCHVRDPTQERLWPHYLGWVAFMGDSFGGEGNNHDEAADDAVRKLKQRLEFLVRAGRPLDEGMHSKTGLLHRECMERYNKYYIQVVMHEEEPDVSFTDIRDYSVFADIIEGKVKQIGWCMESEWHVWKEPVLTSL